MPNTLQSYEFFLICTNFPSFFHFPRLSYLSTLLSLISYLYSLLSYLLSLLSYLYSLISLTRARTLLYTHAHIRMRTYAYLLHDYVYECIYLFQISDVKFLIPTDTLKGLIDNQSLTKKMMFYSIFFVKIFGQFAKKQYLCTRFRAYCK